MTAKNLIRLVFIFLTLPILLSACGSLEKIKSIHKPVDLRKTPLDPDERARKNIEEGRGISIKGLGNSKTTYEFSTSNPMWRASLETLDFLPLTTVDYSGGIIITEWYTEGTSNDEAIKKNVQQISMQKLKGNELVNMPLNDRCWPHH